MSRDPNDPYEGMSYLFPWMNDDDPRDHEEDNERGPSVSERLHLRELARKAAHRVFAKDMALRVLLPMLTVVIVNHLMETSLAALRAREGELLPAAIAHPAVEILLETLVSVFVWIVTRLGMPTVCRIGSIVALFCWLVVWTSFFPNAPRITAQIGATYAVFLGVSWGSIFEFKRCILRYDLEHADDDYYSNVIGIAPDYDRLGLTLYLTIAYVLSFVSTGAFLIGYIRYFFV